MFEIRNTAGVIRTPTPGREPDPKSGASANSATAAVALFVVFFAISRNPVVGELTPDKLHCMRSDTREDKASGCRDTT